MKISRKVVLTAIILILLASVVAGIVLLSDKKSKSMMIEDVGPTHLAGPFRIQLSINPEKPKTGKNRITFVVRNQDNQPVKDAEISAVAEMPAMGAMQAMTVPVEINPVNSGVYQGEFELPMDGTWPLTVKISSVTQGQAQLTLDMATSRKGLRLSTATPSSMTPERQLEESLLPSSKQPTTFRVDTYRRQLIGVTTGTVAKKHLIKIIRAAGKVSYDETRLTDISLKFDGWIGRLYANSLGAPVTKGWTLFTVYSPELVSAQDEYLDTLRRNSTGSNGLRAAARRRLTLWDIGQAQIRALEKRGKAVEYLPIPSPASGIVIEKSVVSGTAVRAGARLLRIADLSTVWVEGQIYESELPWVRVGMGAEVVLPDIPGQSFPAKVTFINPYLEGDTRTARIRVELSNPEGILRPDMYAHLILKVDLGQRLVVPEEAVLFAGERRIVFLDLGDGRLQPRKIQTGLRNRDLIEVLHGLSESDVIVTSGNFLIAAESKLKAGVDQW